MSYLLLVSAYLLATTSAIVLFKLGVPRSSLAFTSSVFSGGVDVRVLLGVGLYAVSFSLWLALLAAKPVVHIVPLTTGLVHVLLVAAGVTILHEKISTVQLCGVGLIIAGAVLVSLKTS